MLDKIANANPIILQKVGDKPSEPKLFPIRVVIGVIFSLNLLSKYHDIFHSLTNNLCYPNCIQLFNIWNVHMLVHLKYTQGMIVD